LRLRSPDGLAFRHHVALVVTLTSAMAVGLAALGTLAYEARRFYGTLEEDFLSLAQIVGANSVGALAFNDAPAARETLAALSLKPNVVSARLFTADGLPFSTYRRPGADSEDVPSHPGAPGHRFEAGHLLIVERVVHDGDQLGSLYMRVDTRQGLVRLRTTLLVLIVCFVAATGVALAFSTRLQRRVSQPVLNLAEAAQAITKHRDYSIRVQPNGPRELRALTLVFNEMLSQIQERDTALLTARDDLELRVAERVRELQHEVAERRKAEAESHRRAQRLLVQSAALESAADAIAITDRDQLIQWVNPSFCSLMGYSFEELLGRDVEMFRTGRPEDTPQYRELTTTVRAGEVWDGELLTRRRDGTPCLIAQTVTPVRIGKGPITHYVAVMRDVSNRHRLEEQLRRAQKMEAIGRLSGGVAHDFNNLLNVILGFGEMLVSRLQPSDPLRRYADEIMKAAKRGASLTRQLLAFSRQQVLQPKVVDLNATVADMGRMVSRLIGEDVELVTSLQPDLGSVVVDPGQIEQVIMNLAVNARDAMPRGGTLTIETANVDLTEADVQEHEFRVRPGLYALLRVCDTGSGMDAATLSHVFEPFFTTKPIDQGTGLGLATVYGIVKQSNGYIWVNSSVTQGTTFTIVLPRIASVVVEQAQADEGGSERSGRETILLVEDDESARGLWQETLEMLGYSTICARDGIEALEVADDDEVRIHLLLSDVVMPRLGGRELASRLRLRRPDLRVIFMSGYTADAILREGLAESEFAFLQKPFTAKQLSVKIKEALEDSA
jgi:PAS domain S-box-containing protein